MTDIISIYEDFKKEFLKLEESSMFPKNWTLKRIQQEIAFVYENTVLKRKGLTYTKKGISNYEGLCSEGFKVRIQIKENKIINAHPIINF